ncbi:MAG TPA: EamA family transporter [Acidobacteriaceae bacterium]|nr:EamA family transporter [Acidobacteriaceae bacterium]
MASGGSVAGLGLSAAATWGAADFAGGLATKKAAPAFVVAVAHGFSLVLLCAAAFSLHAAGSGYNLYGFLSGIFCGVGLIALYAALSRGSMGLSAALSGVITAISPVVFSWFNEGHATPRRLVGFAVAAVAIWMVAYTPGQNSASGARPRGLGLAVVAGLCFGAMLIFMHLAAAEGILGPLISMRITSTSVGALAGIWYWLAHGKEGSSGSGFPTGKVFVLALVAGTLDTSGNLLYLFASQAGRLDVSAVLASLYPAGTMLLAAWLLRERATRSQIAGMALALAAVALIAA